MGKYVKPKNVQLRRMLGERFARLRKQADWTVEYVAEIADVAVGTVSGVENGGGASLEVIYDLAQAYGTTLSAIFSEMPEDRGARRLNDMLARWRILRQDDQERAAAFVEALHRVNPVAS